ncbi:MAG: CoA ester lyase [Rhodospirillales bacterium]|jgi:citrate lyase subunit beta / citryl-CoA lyase|nr:CoA ester lyase [Rhodospirillales bacterium]MBT4039681.1 CoA ester lyase [Rhodospirillales bacterium]MBT4626459.1 CoA ester lyase [Rhodospirillales bacterium]MBT5350858.1 CoA ester lyase [Rhodospirillales bacterium]MBT5520702.1 CoA ester lyase [Rhodospirillales bacterium]
MNKDNRPHRSVLYMPGSNARALEKGRTLAADALILDLEDAVAPNQKDEARNNICGALAEGGYGMRELLIRVNGFQTEWGIADMTAAATSGAHGIVIPKVESPDTVRMAETILEDNGAPDDMAIWCMIETPFGVLSAERIAASGNRIAGFVMGTSDLAKDVHAAHTRDRQPMLYSLSQCLLVARAYGLTILDGVHLNLADDEGFYHSCIHGRDLGFDGKTLIHPKTIDTANEVFAPSEKEVAWSKQIIEAFTEAQGRGEGVVLVDGKLIENLHVEDAKRSVALAEAIEEMAAANTAA